MKLKITGLYKLSLGLGLIHLGAMTVKGQETSTNASSQSVVSPEQSGNAVPGMIAEVHRHLERKEWDAALEKVNAILKLDAMSVQAHIVRGSIYAQKKEWNLAGYDYDIARGLDPDNEIVRFDLAELEFMQKQYDAARTSFVELKADRNIGDFATYKIFLCDLFGAHEDVAAKDLDAINQVGGNPSYYFGNAAWDLFHHNSKDARGWFDSACRIYADVPGTIENYTSSLSTLGYLPLPSASPVE
jgi:tetratricopeptide (TPR) repeat protein